MKILKKREITETQTSFWNNFGGKLSFILSFLFVSAFTCHSEAIILWGLFCRNRKFLELKEVTIFGGPLNSIFFSSLSPFPSLVPIMKIGRSLILKVQKMGTQDKIRQFTHEVSKEISLPYEKFHHRFIV
jgi:hypothetical protein